MQRRGRARTRLVSLLLALCTVAGLALMHSFGHQALMHSHGDRGHDHAVHEPGAGLVGLGAVAVRSAGVHCGDGCSDPVAERAPVSGHDHLMDLCFAILGGVLLLLLRRAAARSRDGLLLPRTAGVATATSRSPPRLGLTLATAAVLRT